MESTDTNPIMVIPDERIEATSTTREAPEALRDLIAKNTNGLRRIVVFEVLGKNNLPKLNAVKITGAKAGRPIELDASDELMLVLMRIVSAHLEKSGQAAKFAFQTHHINAAGKSDRGQSRVIEFDGIYDAVTGASQAGEGNEEHFEMLRYLTAQNRHTLNILDRFAGILGAVERVTKQQGAYTEVVVGRLTDALVRERTAVHEAGQAQAETTAINNEHSIELQKLQQRSEFMELMSPAIQHATSQIGVEAAGKLTSGKSKNKSKSEAKKSNPLAAMGKKKPKTEEGKPKLEVVDVEAVEVEDDTHEDEEARLDAIKEERPQSFAVGMLRLSLDDDQEPKVKAALGEEGWAAFQRAADADTNEETLEALIDLWEVAPKDSATKLLKITNARQQGVLGSLRMATMHHQKTNPREET